MNYIEMVYDAVQYIESNLMSKLTLEELASRYYISPTHFYRIFRAVTNQTVKSYIIERKLSTAAIALKATDLKVIDIAFQYGFNSHEQFTRAFKSMFYINPSTYRKGNMKVALSEKADIVERCFKNKNKDVIVDFYCRDIKETKLVGKEFTHNPECADEIEQLIHGVAGFFEEHIVQGSATQLFTINGSASGNLGRKYCFYGIPVAEHSGDWAGLSERVIPESKYAVFIYPQFMAVVFRTVLKDLDKWLYLSGLEFNHDAGIDFFELFAEDYEQTQRFYLHIPVL